MRNVEIPSPFILQAQVLDTQVITRIITKNHPSLPFIALHLNLKNAFSLKKTTMKAKVSRLLRPRVVVYDGKLWS